MQFLVVLMLFIFDFAVLAQERTPFDDEKNERQRSLPSEPTNRHPQRGQRYIQTSQHYDSVKNVTIGKSYLEVSEVAVSLPENDSIIRGVRPSVNKTFHTHIGPIRFDVEPARELGELYRDPNKSLFDFSDKNLTFYTDFHFMDEFFGPNLDYKLEFTIVGMSPRGEYLRTRLKFANEGLDRFLVSKKKEMEFLIDWKLESCDDERITSNYDVSTSPKDILNALNADEFVPFGKCSLIVERAIVLENISPEVFELSPPVIPTSKFNQPTPVKIKAAINSNTKAFLFEDGNIIINSDYSYREEQKPHATTLLLKKKVKEDTSEVFWENYEKIRLLLNDYANTQIQLQDKSAEERKVILAALFAKNQTELKEALQKVNENFNSLTLLEQIFVVHALHNVLQYMQDLEKLSIKDPTEKNPFLNLNERVIKRPRSENQAPELLRNKDSSDTEGKQ